MLKTLLKKSPILIITLTVLICLVILILIYNFISTIQNKDREILLGSTADIITLRMKNSLESRFSLVDALGALYETNPEIDESTFIKVAKAFIDENLPVRALQLSDNETYVKYIYPIKTNEKIYKKPIKLLDDKLRGRWVKQTLQSRVKSIQTPFELRQGGIGTVVRKAIFTDSTFIGLSIGVINLSDILNESISDKENENFNIEICDSDFKPFYKNRAIIDSQFVHRELTLPGTVWNLQFSENLQIQKNRNMPVILLWTFGIIIIFIIILFEISILNYNRHLQKTISIKTKELKENQIQINQIENLRSLGKLAGGIAHNFNNQLNTIIGFSELIKGDPQNVSDVELYAKKILKTSKKSAELVSRITSFSRQGKYREDEIDIHSLLNMITNNFSSSVNIKFILNLRAKRFQISGDYSEIKTAIKNIIQNSIEAIIDEGAIIINTENIYLDKRNKIVLDNYLKSGNYLHLHIEDNGRGIDTETIKHIFEPFYTTKDVAFGAGMGLSSAYGSILEHDGHIDIKSTQDKWSVVEIYLPVVDVQ